MKKSDQVNSDSIASGAHTPATNTLNYVNKKKWKCLSFYFFVEVNKPNYVKISTLVLIMAGLWLFRAKHQNFF